MTKKVVRNRRVYLDKFTNQMVGLHEDYRDLLKKKEELSSTD